MPLSSIAYRVEFMGEPPVGVLTFVSDGCAALIGQDAAVIVASPGVWMAAIHPDDRDLFVQSTTQLLVDGATVTRHYRVRHDETGEYQLIEDRLAATVDGKGDVTGYEAVITRAH